MSAFVWTTVVKQKGVAVATYSHRLSRTHSADVTGTSLLPAGTASDIVVLLPGASPDRLSRLHTLPNTVRCPLVDDILGEIITQFAGDGVQFLPVTVRTKYGDVIGFHYARPLIGLPCVDLEKSDIASWVLPGKIIMDARLLVFNPSCLGSRHLARDMYTDHVVVSEQLRDALLAVGDDGLKFERPEEIWNILK
jgi:hypothetical protein